jgi:very-short-patch-repair endonuclease
LRGKTWERISTGLYRWSEQREDPWLTLSAWRRVLPPEAVFDGESAAWLLGLEGRPTDPVEVVVPPSSGIRTRAGIQIRHCAIAPSEVISIQGLRTTAVPLTLAGLCQRRSTVEALVAIDIAFRLGLADASALVQYAESAKGRRGAKRMKALALLAAPAESPMETRLRCLLIKAGLPRPQVQVDLRDAAAHFVGRADLYYPDARLVVEYDGANHRERLVEDNRRQNLLVNAGYRLLRFTVADLNRSDVVIAQVREALQARRL